MYLEVVVGVQSSTRQVRNVTRPSPAHVLLGEDEQVNAAALLDALLGQ